MPTTTTFHDFTGTPVRFFSLDCTRPADKAVLEISEPAFAELVKYGAVISYERHTVRENGVSQICLTAEVTHD